MKRLGSHITDTLPTGTGGDVHQTKDGWHGPSHENMFVEHDTVLQTIGIVSLQTARLIPV